MAAPNLLWSMLVPGCFGMADLMLARHELDENSAKSMVRAAKESGAIISGITEAIEIYLNSEGASSAHINNELEYARKFIARYFK